MLTSSSLRSSAARAASPASAAAVPLPPLPSLKPLLSFSPHARTAPDRLPGMHLLVVDDDPPIRLACGDFATGLGFIPHLAESVPSARDVLAQHPIDLVLLDLKLPGAGGLTLLTELRAERPETVVVIMTAYATVSSAVEAMRIGAGDYITKPFTLEELSTVLERASHRRAFDVESRALRDQLRSGRGPGNLVGRSPAMEKLYRMLSKVTGTAHPVLITGEAGTGKEVVARSIHLNGPNAGRAFVPVDCAALPPAQLEQELFGYTRNAFPGAFTERTGLLSNPENGTVFLDEIAELPLELQTRLLRTLQERQVRPLGSNTAVPVCARILAASNRDLPAMVESGRFRKDLYFRLNIVNLRIPALRERKTDVPLLAANTLDRLRREGGVEHTFSDEALRLLVDYEWPGNVRELEHAIERACAFSSGSVLHLADFPTQLQNHFRAHMAEDLQPTLAAGHGRHAATPGSQTVLSIAEMEKMAILNTIRQLNGDKLRAAKLLGIGKTTLYRKLKEYGLDHEL